MPRLSSPGPMLTDAAAGVAALAPVEGTVPGFFGAFAAFPAHDDKDWEGGG